MTVTLADFFDLLLIVEGEPDLDRPMNVTGLVGGDVLTSQRARPRWEGTFSLANMTSRKGAQTKGLLADLEVPGATFEMCNPHFIGPAADPLGAGLNGFTPTIEFVSADQKSIKLQGLPSGYQITSGDLISFFDGGAQSYHRIKSDRVATDGTTGLLALVPELRVAPAIGTGVQLVRPVFHAVILPGSVDYGTTRFGNTRGISFSFRQTLR
jgi:hypothetical protein